MSNSKGTQPRSRVPVRVGHLEQTLKDFNAEMGEKVAYSMKVYHLKYIAPLEARLDWLELPFYRRGWYLFKGFVIALSNRIRDKVKAWRTPADDVEPAA